MLMVQSAVRTLLNAGIQDSKQLMNIINQVVYFNMQRIDSDKNLTLSLLSYQAGLLRITGQHEDVLVIRKNKSIEQVNTLDLGFMVGWNKI